MTTPNDNILSCPECGCTAFLQKLVHKTGVRVVNGRAVFNRVFSSPTFVYLFCENCHAILTSSIVKKLTPLPSDYEVRN